MKRKSFLKGAIGVAAAGTLLGGRKIMAQEKDDVPCEKKLAGKNKFLAAMRKHIGENNARREGNKITLVYEKCFCPLVAGVEGTLPGEYCLCTVGWTKAVYGAVAGKEVKVDLKSSIKRGDPKCLIEVDLG